MNKRMSIPEHQCIFCCIEMEASNYTRPERRLASERNIKYLGTASIEILALDISPQHTRELDRENVERLRKLFETEGCHHTDIQNHVPAIIGEEQLAVALQAAGITADALLHNTQEGPPELDFPADYRLECLHGRHRLHAGLEALPRHGRRWTVDLYLTGAHLVAPLQRWRFG